MSGHAGKLQSRPGVQAAFGMGDDVEFFTARLFNDVPYPVGQLPAAVRHRGGRLMVSVIDSGSRRFQRLGDTAPVIEIAEVPEKHAVYHQDRIPGGTGKQEAVGPAFPEFAALKYHFPGGRSKNQEQGDQMGDGDEAAENADNPQPDPKLTGGQVYPQYAVPEEQSLSTQQYQAVEKPEAGTAPGQRFHTRYQAAHARRGQGHIDQGGGGKYDQQIAASVADVQAVTGGAGQGQSRIEVQQEEQPGRHGPEQSRHPVPGCAGQNAFQSAQQQIVGSQHGQQGAQYVFQNLLRF